MRRIANKGKLAEAVNEFGVLPLFKNRIAGWSVEEYADRAIWFTDAPGPWEWKGELALERACVYSKLIRGKAAFVSMDVFPELANFRRGGMEFEDRVDSGLVPRREMQLMEYVQAHPDCLSRDARRECGVVKGYDTALTHLQMQTYIIFSDFRYSIDRHGRPYGWGNSALCAPEDWLDEALLANMYDREPEDSLNAVLDRITAALPGTERGLLISELGARLP